MRPEDGQGHGDEQSLVAAGRFVALGLEFAGTVVAGVFVGYHLDRWLGSAPLCTLVVSLTGMGGAVYRLLWNLKRVGQGRRDGR